MWIISECAVIHSLPASRTAHNPKRGVVMARATFRPPPLTRGIRAPASDRQRPELLRQPQRLGLESPTSSPSPGGLCCLDSALARFLKTRSRGRLTTRTLSTAFPNSRSRTSPRSATGIRADARAYTPARDGGLREKACSTAFPHQPAKAEPSRLCETSRRGPHNRRALQRASPRSERRSPPIPHGPAAACSARG